MAITGDLRERIREHAAQLQQEIYGERGGPGLVEKRFVDLESEATQLGDAIACELLGGVLQAQADQTAEASPGQCECSVCGREAARDDIQSRVVQARRGKVTWREPRYFCKHCRKAFFPSVENSGR